MRDIRNFHADKYPKQGIAGLFAKSKYKRVEDGVFAITENSKTRYVTSLSFVQEPDLNEGENAAMISQYPLEDLLDKFLCYVSDFYDELNAETSQTCFQEFASPNLDDIKKLRTIIGKHVYNKERIGEDGRTSVDLIIE